MGWALLLPHCSQSPAPRGTAPFPGPLSNPREGSAALLDPTATAQGDGGPSSSAGGSAAGNTQCLRGTARAAVPGGPRLPCDGSGPPASLRAPARSPAAGSAPAEALGPQTPRGALDHQASGPLQTARLGLRPWVVGGALGSGLWSTPSPLGRCRGAEVSLMPRFAGAAQPAPQALWDPPERALCVERLLRGSQPPTARQRPEEKCQVGTCPPGAPSPGRTGQGPWFHLLPCCWGHVAHKG